MLSVCVLRVLLVSPTVFASTVEFSCFTMALAVCEEYLDLSLHLPLDLSDVIVRRSQPFVSAVPRLMLTYLADCLCRVRLYHSSILFL